MLAQLPDPFLLQFLPENNYNCVPGFGESLSYSDCPERITMAGEVSILLTEQSSSVYETSQSTIQRPPKPEATETTPPLLTYLNCSAVLPDPNSPEVFAPPPHHSSLPLLLSHLRSAPRLCLPSSVSVTLTRFLFLPFLKSMLCKLRKQLSMGHQLSLPLSC